MLSRQERLAQFKRDFGISLPDLLLRYPQLREVQMRMYGAYIDMISEEDEVEPTYAEARQWVADHPRNPYLVYYVPRWVYESYKGVYAPERDDMVPYDCPDDVYCTCESET